MKFNLKKIFPKIKFETTHDEDDLAFDIGLMVQEIRITKGLTQKDLAIMLDTKQSSIARLENGSSLPSLKFLFRIAKTVGTHLLPPRFALLEDIKINTEAKNRDNLLDKFYPNSANNWVISTPTKLFTESQSSWQTTSKYFTN